MIFIKYFLLGILFSVAILPIIEELVALILTLCELGKTILALKISKSNIELKKLLEPEEEELSTNAIGFVVDPVEYDDDEDEEEEYD